MIDKSLSVVVPVYNAEKYLKRCIESILNQTYDHLQIVLIDDGSTDSSLKICEAYAEYDRRILVVPKKNGGVVSARKEGVKVAIGEMIGFVDADDWVEDSYFERLMKIQRESMADIVAAGHFHDIGSSSREIFNKISSGLHRTIDILDRLLYSGEFYEYGITPQLYTKIFRADILKSRQKAVDERIKCGEDAAVVYPSILKAKSIYVTDFCGYHYVQHQGTMTKTGNKEEIYLIQILITYLETCFKTLVSNSPSQEKLLNQLKVYNNYLLLLREISVFDEKVLLPFGGIAYGSKVVIYGAGVLGQKIYQYLSRTKHVEIVGWVDRNFDYYRENDFEVDEIEEICKKEYDFILIANISYRVFVQIKEYLVEKLMVKEKKIRWFSSDFITG